MTDEERQRLLDTRYDVDLYPSTRPRRRHMRLRNKSAKQLRTQHSDPTSKRAINRIVYSTKSKEW